MPAAQPLWRMSLSGSELARITREGDDIVLVFAVAQVRPEAAPRFGQGDDTAYLAGVTWRLLGVDAPTDASVAGDVMGRLADCELWVTGESRARVACPLPGSVAGPLRLTLRSALGEVWSVQAQGLVAVLPQDGEARPSLAC